MFRTITKKDYLVTILETKVKEVSGLIQRFPCVGQVKTNKSHLISRIVQRKGCGQNPRKNENVIYKLKFIKFYFRCHNTEAPQPIGGRRRHAPIFYFSIT